MMSTRKTIEMEDTITTITIATKVTRDQEIIPPSLRERALAFT
jgi:hypothetical protein